MMPTHSYVANILLCERYRGIGGAIAECGTWKGGMIAGIARSLGALRNYYLFDSFEGLPPAEEIDGLAAGAWQSDKQGMSYFDNCTANESDAWAAMRKAGVASPNVIKGWFEETLPKAVFPEGIAILRLDADWYASTMTILENLFPKVNIGGLIIVDDYYMWDGCSKAIHAYLSSHSRAERICSYQNVCYLEKRPVSV